MIGSKSDFEVYMREDMFSQGLNGWRFWYFLKYPTIYFLRCLRRIEYYHNYKTDRVSRIIYLFLKVHFRVFSIYIGFTIPPNTCGPGLALNHWGTIVISPQAKIGKKARINTCVNIGIKDGGAPVIGDDVYIGPGAKIFGAIKIGDRVKVGANSVVNKSFDNDVTIIGVPARIIERDGVVD